MFQEDEYFRTLSKEKIWQRYCGFFDLSLLEYMEIQNKLLLEQIGILAGAPIGGKLMTKKPCSAAEFRQVVPLTTCDDYSPYFNRQQEDVLPEEAYFWCHGASHDGNPRWVPHTRRAFEVAGRQCLGLAILASAGAKGEVNFRPGSRILTLMPPRPYSSGAMLYHLSQHFPVRFLPSLEETEKMDLSSRIFLGFKFALDGGVDGVFSTPSLLVKMGEVIASHAAEVKAFSFLWHPAAAQRLGRAWLRCQIEGRPILPRDLWPMKAVMTAGLDTDIYRDGIIKYWGHAPYEFYASTEAVVMAAQAWNRKWLTFLPDTAFWEFIPEEEGRMSREENGYQPRTVLLYEVEVGKSYEVVLTRFYGVPLLRYRTGDIVTCMASRDDEVGIGLPQMALKSSVSATIELANLCRLGEKTLGGALAASGIDSYGWAAAKEYDRHQTYLRLYLEPKDKANALEIERRIDGALKGLDADYRNLESYLGLQPVRVTLLTPGTFERYSREQTATGSEHLNASRINPPAATIETLLRLSRRAEALRPTVAVSSEPAWVVAAACLAGEKVLARVRAYVDPGIKDLVETLNTIDNVWTLGSSQGRAGENEIPAEVSLYYGQSGRTSIPDLALFTSKVAGVLSGVGSRRTLVSLEWAGDEPVPRIVIGIPPGEIDQVTRTIAGAKGVFSADSPVT